MKGVTQEDLTIINICASDISKSNFLEQILLNVKVQIGFNTRQWMTPRCHSHQQLFFNKEISELNAIRL